MLKSPCKNCEKRITGQTHASCHAHCRDYKDFRELVDIAEKKRHQDDDFEDYVSHACEKAKRKHNR